MLDVDLGTEKFDLIANFYFLERDLIPRIKQALKPGGLVFFETFTSYQNPTRRSPLSQIPDRSE